MNSDVLPEKPMRPGLGEILVLCLLAIIFMLMLGLLFSDLGSVLLFSSYHPEGGDLLWTLPMRFTGATLSGCLLVVVSILVFGKSRKTIPLFSFLVLTPGLVFAATLYFDAEAISYTKQKIEDQGMALCKEATVGRGKYVRKSLEFRPSCN